RGAGPSGLRPEQRTAALRAPAAPAPRERLRLASLPALAFGQSAASAALQQRGVPRCARNTDWWYALRAHHQLECC
ncbi:hypothetical protein ACKI18_47655, partial [Streptomyces niveiscabiei]